MNDDEKLIFLKVSEFIKSNKFIKSINLLNEKLLLIKKKQEKGSGGSVNEEFKLKIILILGKLYLKINQVDTIIPIIENELKSNSGSGSSASIKYQLMSILYRCYYLKSSIKSIKSNQNQYNAKITTNHAPTLNTLNNKINNLSNLSSIHLSRNRKVEIKFKFNGDGSMIDEEEDDEDEDNKNKLIYNFNDDLNIQQFVEGHGILETFKFKIPIRSVSCGRYFSMALDSNGMIWNWGLQVEICSNGQNSPSFPHSFHKSFKSISAGHHHCLALATDGTAYAWGTNTFGSICKVECSYERSPKLVQFIQDDSTPLPEEIIKIAAGGFNSAFISSSGKLLVCGRNNRLQLGVPYSFPNFPFTKESSRFAPSILISGSTITRDYSQFVNNKQFSDLQIKFDDDHIVYCHLILLTSLRTENNNKLLIKLSELKSTPSNIEKIVKLTFKEFIELSTEYSSGGKDSINKKLITQTILNLSIDDSYTSFIDFISFIYTNNTSKRYKEILEKYSELFSISELSNYLKDNTFNIIQEESNLKISNQLSSRFNNEFLSDCNVVCSSGIEIKSHKVILAARSELFKNIFKESGDEISSIKMRDDIKENQVIPLIAYLYCDRIKFDLINSQDIDGDYILELYKSAELFNLQRFKDGLMKLISQSVSVENADSLIEWSKKNNALALEKFILCFIGLHDELKGSKYYSYVSRPYTHYSSNESYQYLPIHVLKDETFINVTIGAKLMLALTSDNKLFQLGFGSDRSKSEVQQIKLPSPDENSKIQKISCGSSHCIVVTENKNIYGWGCGDLDQLVVGKKKLETCPTLIYSNEFNNAKAGFYASIYWNDLSNFPLHPLNKQDVTTPTTPSPSIIDKPVTIEVYYNENQNENLWFFKNYKSTKSLLESTDTSSSSSTITNTENDYSFEKSIISTSTTLLPPYLLDVFNNQNNEGESIKLFGFSKELIEKSFSNNIRNIDIGSGDDAITLLFLSTSFGNYKLSMQLFELFKKSLDLEKACLLLTCIYNSNYSFQLSFLFSHLLGFIGSNKFELFKNNDLLNSLPKQILRTFIKC